MVEYIYDAWGNHAVLDAKGFDIVSAMNIGNRNFFHNRGNFYDTEKGLYFFKTRYNESHV